MESKAGKRIAFLKLHKWDVLCLLLLMSFPLRHVNIGVDLWDTGYNYANFTNMGLDHMDSMWLFSTYLATALGHFFTLLPGGQTLLGLNIYTGLTVSLLGAAAYLFCRKKLGYSLGEVLPGVFMAECLCWCPTALLYNYLTYILLLAAVMLLFCGLSGEKRLLLVLAGICLGTNVFVRFSNLPEMVLILGVWAYDFLVCQRDRELNKWFQKTARHTLWCLLGYLAAAAVLFGYIVLRYGFAEYIRGIARLFTMTENASDYKASAMLMGVVNAFREQVYWIGKIVCILLVGLVMGLFAKGDSLFPRKKNCLWLWKAGVILTSLAGGLWLWKGTILAILQSGESGQKALLGAVTGALLLLALIVLGLKQCTPGMAAAGFSGILAVAVLIWLWQQHFCSNMYYSYDSMHIPAIAVLFLFILVTLVRILSPRAELSEKLISGLLLLSVMVASIGSNNGVYPSVNFLFLAGPYLFHELYEFTTAGRDLKIGKMQIFTVPAKVILWAVMALCCFQFSAFGGKFVFAEATGVRFAYAEVDNNEVLKGVKMTTEKAEALQEATAYVKSAGLVGEDCIPYGDVPALSFYLSMPASFNPWCNLDSYSKKTFEKALAELDGEKPVILLGREYADYLEGGRERLEEKQVNANKIAKIEQDGKLKLLVDFMEEMGYEETYRNDFFVIYE